jgi:hypothetical protein
MPSDDEQISAGNILINRNKLQANSASCWSYCTDILISFSYSLRVFIHLSLNISSASLLHIEY